MYNVKYSVLSPVTYAKTYTREIVFVRIIPFPRHSSDRSYLTSWITPYQTSSTSHYDHRSLERWPFLARPNNFPFNFHKMYERHLEEWKLNGFKQDLCCRGEERGQKANKKTKNLTACKMGPQVDLTQLSFLFWIKEKKSDATKDSTHYWIYKPVRIKLRDPHWAKHTSTENSTWR